MTERDKILARIREALTLPAPRPGHAHANDYAARPTSPGTLASTPSGWLPEVGPTFEDRLALFRKNVADLKADFHVTDSSEEASRILVGIRDAEGWKKIGAHGGALTDPVCEALGLQICRTDRAYEAADLESCDAGLSECDALVAQTGSVLVTGRSAGGRALSVLLRITSCSRGENNSSLICPRRSLCSNEDMPQISQLHLAHYRSEPDRRYRENLVLGAHGPKKLTIVCW